MFLIHRMSFSAFFVPLSRRYFRKEGVGFRSNVVYFRQTKFVGKRKCLSVDACATYYIDVLIFLAALQDVPVDLKEAAQIDGATAIRTFFSITLPQIMPVVIFVVLISFIGSLKGFDQFYIMTKGGPARSTTTIMYYFYEVAFTNMKTGKEAAIAMVFTAIVLAFTAVQRILSSRLAGADGVN